MWNSFDIKVFSVIILLVHSIESDMTEVTEHARTHFVLKQVSLR